MNPVLIQRLFSLIQEEWKALPGEGKPWGIWITLHAPLAAAATHALQEAPLQQAWFLEEGMDKPQKRSVWAFMRFWVMHFERPWNMGNYVARDLRFSDRWYPLGLAAFAPYADSPDLFLEMICGRFWAWGRRLTLTPEGVIGQVHILWIA